MQCRGLAQHDTIQWFTAAEVDSLAGNSRTTDSYCSYCSAVLVILVMRAPGACSTGPVLYVDTRAELCHCFTRIFLVPFSCTCVLLLMYIPYSSYLTPVLLFNIYWCCTLEFVCLCTHVLLHSCTTVFLYSCTHALLCSCTPALDDLADLCYPKKVHLSVG